MSKFILQPYADGNIYKHDDGTYSVEVTAGKAKGKTVAEALKKLAKKETSVKTEKKEAKEKKVVDSK